MGDPAVQAHGGVRARQPEAPAGGVFFSYGFRPFFLLAGLYAGIAIPVWMAALHGFAVPGAPLAPVAWHAHEMLFGFVMAGVAGFLLTAVPSWTGASAIAGAPLAALVAIWLAGRAAVTLPLGLPAAVVAAIDLAFPLALALAVLPSLLASPRRRNLLFVGLLALVFIANLRFHLAGGASPAPLLLAVDTLALMVALVGGRVVPSFTAAWLARQGRAGAVRRRPPLDAAALVAVAAVLVVDLVAPGGVVAGATAALAALLLAARLAGWQGHRTLAEPIVWVLHLAYAWLPVGFALKAAWLLGGWTAGAGWLHALTAGAFATMLLAVMSRAALGHTGRALVAPRTAVAAYLLVTAAALSRVFAPVLFPGAWMPWLAVSACLWTAAFVLFVFAYAPILCGARADG